jgi:hypothetical protein
LHESNAEKERIEVRRRRKTSLVLVVVGVLVVLVYAVAARSGGIAAVSTSKVKYNNYSYQDVSLKVSLPETTHVTEDYYSSGEMLLNSYLCDDKLNYHGYIQIWNIEDPEEFIEKSKLNSTFRFTSFEHKKFTHDSYSDFVATWTAQLQDSGDIAGKDYLLQKKGKDDQFLRISLTVNEAVFPEKLAKVEETIISSLEWK